MTDRDPPLTPPPAAPPLPDHPAAARAQIDEMLRGAGLRVTRQRQAIAEVLLRVKETVHFCEICFNVAESNLCRVCADPQRDTTMICVVEESKDVVAIERTREFRGRYHVLGGALNPIEGIGPGDLHVTELMARLGDSTLTEIIIATNPNHTGDATASYLARQIGPMGIKVSRLASGLPVGGDLEYADEVTLGRAFEGRRVFA